jgi:hypothetical protein
LLTCLLYRLLCGFVRLLARRGGQRELEIVVLRHQVAILASRNASDPHDLYTQTRCIVEEVVIHRWGRGLRGSSRLIAAGNARSAVKYCGLPARLRIASWWRSTTISSARSWQQCASKRTKLRRSRYCTHVSTTRSLNRPGRDHPQQPFPGEPSFFTRTLQAVSRKRGGLGRPAFYSRGVSTSLSPSC